MLGPDSALEAALIQSDDSDTVRSTLRVLFYVVDWGWGRG